MAWLHVKQQPDANSGGYDEIANALQLIYGREATATQVSVALWLVMVPHRDAWVHAGMRPSEPNADHPQQALWLSSGVKTIAAVIVFERCIFKTVKIQWIGALSLRRWICMAMEVKIVKALHLVILRLVRAVSTRAQKWWAIMFVENDPIVWLVLKSADEWCSTQLCVLLVHLVTACLKPG